MKIVLTLGLLLIAALASAQPRPGAFTTLTTTSPAPTSICVGCPVGSATPVLGSAITTAAVVLPSGAPAVTTNKLYSIGGSLFFNGTGLAAGSSVSGTTGKISKFTSPTSLSDSLLTEAGSTVSMAGTFAATVFSGSGASLTGVGLLGAGNTWTNTQTISPGAGVLPLVLIGSDSAASGLVAQFISNSAGRSSALYFSDGSTYAQALGTDGSGNLHFWNGRNIGIAGVSVFAVSSNGNVSIGSGNLTDSIDTPSIASGFGSSPGIAGHVYGFRITVGAGGTTAGVVNFNSSFPTAPVCVVNVNTAGAPAVTVTTTTTQLTIASGGGLAAGDTLHVLCRGIF